MLRTQGLEVEAPLAFAALHRLLRPLTRLRAGLPEPQARALRVAFGEEEGPSVEPFLVGVATLSLLTTAAEENLVLCVVDDAHWLDPATADALLFCARRLGADRVAMVFAARDGAWGTFDPQGLPELVADRPRPGRLPGPARRAHSGDAPADEVAERLVAETRGNPLALLELPGELTPDQLSGSAPLPSQLHLTARVEQAFLDRSRRLPPPVQTVLLLAAADDTGEPDVLRRAAAGLGLGEADLQAALDSGLLVGDADVVVGAPPAGALGDLPGRDRRAATAPCHRALAEALAGHGDPDREAWHRAVRRRGTGPGGGRRPGAGRVPGPATRRVRRRTRGVRTSRGTLRRPGPARRARPLPQRAAPGRAAGPDRRRRCSRRRARRASDPLLLGDIARLRGHIEVNLGSAAEAHRIFVEAAQEVYPFDPARALDIGVAAAVMRTFGADSGTPLPSDDALARCRRRRPAADAVPATPARRDDPGGRGRLGRRASRPWTWRWTSATQVDDRDVLWNLANAALQLGDDQAQQHFYGYALSRAREAGRRDRDHLLPPEAVLRPLPGRRPRRRAQQRRGGPRPRPRASASRR